MLLEKIISDLIANLSSLKGVPRPILDAVVREALAAIEDTVPDDIPVMTLFGEGWEKCESCGVVVLPGVSGEVCGDGVALCDFCLPEETAEAGAN